MLRDSSNYKVLVVGSLNMGEPMSGKKIPPQIAVPLPLITP